MRVTLSNESRTFTYLQSTYTQISVSFAVSTATRTACREERKQQLWGYPSQEKHKELFLTKRQATWTVKEHSTPEATKWFLYSVLARTGLSKCGARLEAFLRCPSQSRRHEEFGGLIPPKKVPSPVECLSVFRMTSTDNRTSHKTAVQPCIIMLHNNDNSEPNGPDKSAPSNTITGEHTNQIGELQSIVACDSNVAFAQRN